MTAKALSPVFTIACSIGFAPRRTSARPPSAGCVWTSRVSQPSASTIAPGLTTDHAPNVVYAVSPDYFRVLDIPVLHGRAFTEADRAGSERIAIITNAMARRFWGARNPVGRRFKMGMPSSASPPAASADWLTVVGVVGDTISSPYSGRFSEQPYVPLAQQPGRDVTLLARSDADVAAALSSVRDAVRVVEPGPAGRGSRCRSSRRLRAWVSPGAHA